MKLKLSPRLEQLDRMVANGYDQIWDCCCDHGLLGMALLQRQAASKINFVDCVPAITAQLEAQLQSLDIPAAASWQVYCTDVAALSLNSSQNQRHLIIIAGVGGTLALELVRALELLNADQTVNYLLSPIRQIAQVRRGLAELGLGLEQEVLLYDRGQFYELLNVSAQARQPIPLVGDTMWQLNLATHRKYLQQRIRYQSRIAKAGSQLQQQALQAYLALQQKIAGRL